MYTAEWKQSNSSETDHSPQFSAETKTVWSCTSTPSDVMGHCLIKHRDHLIFLRTAA